MLPCTESLEFTRLHKIYLLCEVTFGTQLVTGVFRPCSGADIKGTPVDLNSGCDRLCAIFSDLGEGGKCDLIIRDHLLLDRSGAFFCGRICLFVIRFRRILLQAGVAGSLGRCISGRGRICIRRWDRSLRGSGGEIVREIVIARIFCVIRV